MVITSFLLKKFSCQVVAAAATTLWKNSPQILGGIWATWCPRLTGIFALGCMLNVGTSSSCGTWKPIHVDSGSILKKAKRHHKWRPTVVYNMMEQGLSWSPTDRVGQASKTNLIPPLPLNGKDFSSKQIFSGKMSICYKLQVFIRTLFNINNC